MGKSSVVAAALLCLVLSANTFAQTSNATLGGTAADPTGALVPGVTVTATNTQTGVVTTVLTNESGVYQFAILQPGIYKVTAVLSGFRTQAYDQVELGASQQLRLNFTLQVGAVGQTVDVNVQIDTLIATTSSSVGNVLSEQRVRDLPTTNRDVLDLIRTMAGVTGDGTTASFAGERTMSINTTVDGINTTPYRYENGVFSIVRINQDLVSEFRTILAPADAETGAGSGQVQILTRSGTNQYRGSVNWNIHNSAFDANTWANNFNGVKPGWSNIHQITANYSGPIVKNKTFFFVLFDAQRHYARTNVATTVLTADARKGLFRYFPGVNNGNALSNTTTGGNPVAPVVDFGGNPVRPAAATGPLQSVSVFNKDQFRPGLDPSGWIQKLIGDMPLPNDFTGGDGLNTATYRWNRPTRGTDAFNGVSDTTNRNELNIKIDHIFNDRHKLTVNYTVEADWSQQQQSPWPNGFGGEVGRTPQLLTASFVSTLTPSIVNEFRFGMNRINNHNWANYAVPSTGEAAKAYLPNKNGIPMMVQAGAGNVSFTTHMLTFGTADTNGIQKPVSWTYNDSLSWTKGKHAFKGGVELRYMGSDGYNSQRIIPTAVGGAGNAAVSGISATTFPGLLGSNQTTAQNLLIFLSGSLQNIQEAFTLNDPKLTAFQDYTELAVKGKLRWYKENGYSSFFKDDWKVQKRLTVNLGARWEYYGVPWENRGLMAAPVGGGTALFGYSGRSFDDWKRIGPQKGDLTTVEFVGPHSPNPDKLIHKKDWNNLSPNIGFSWSLPWFGENKTVFRAGYGIAFQQGRRAVTLDVANSLPGLNQFATYTSPTYLDLSNYPLPVPRNKPFEVSPVTERTQTMEAYDPNFVSPYVQNFNASISRTLNRNVSVEVRYVGTKGTKLFGAIPINEVNIYGNGILDAFNITRAGGDAPLFDQMLNGLNINPGVAGTGPVGSFVGNVRVTGSSALRQNTTFRTSIANGNVAAVATTLNSSTIITGQGGGLIRNGGLPENFIVTNPQFGNVTLDTNPGSSRYHSLQAQVNVRPFHGFGYQGTYVWSKSMAVGGTADGFSTWRDATNRSLDRELEASHRTHSFRSNGSFELPFGPNGLLLRNAPGWAARLVERWKLAWILNLDSGAPLNITAIATTNTQANTPDIVGAFPRQGQAKKVDNLAVYFDGYTFPLDPQCANVTTQQTTQTSCTNRSIADANGNLLLVNPKPGKLGTLGRRVLEGPGSFGFDASASKAVKIGEHREFQLRIDALNVLNKPILGNPTLDINSTNFGRITTATGNRTFSASARVNF